MRDMQHITTSRRGCCQYVKDGDQSVWSGLKTDQTPVVPEVVWPAPAAEHPDRGPATVPADVAAADAVPVWGVAMGR